MVGKCIVACLVLVFRGRNVLEMFWLVFLVECGFVFGRSRENWEGFDRDGTWTAFLYG